MAIDLSAYARPPEHWGPIPLADTRGDQRLPYTLREPLPRLDSLSEGETRGVLAYAVSTADSLGPRIRQRVSDQIRPLVTQIEGAGGIRHRILDLLVNGASVHGRPMIVRAVTPDLDSCVAHILLQAPPSDPGRSALKRAVLLLNLVSDAGRAALDLEAAARAKRTGETNEHAHDAWNAAAAWWAALRSSLTPTDLELIGTHYAAGYLPGSLVVAITTAQSSEADWLWPRLARLATNRVAAITLHAAAAAYLARKVGAGQIIPTWSRSGATWNIGGIGNVPHDGTPMLWPMEDL